MDNLTASIMLVVMFFYCMTIMIGIIVMENLKEIKDKEAKKETNKESEVVI